MLVASRCTRQTKALWCRNGCLSYSTYRDIPVLRDNKLSTFQDEAFTPATPALLPRGTFNSLPAVQKWFRTPPRTTDSAELNSDFLRSYGSTIVPLEITHDGNFAQVQQPLDFFLDAAASVQTTRIYLAQASLSDLPPKLRRDIPTPELVLKAGKGDVYDASIWLGRAPTYTPLHRDPNPNLFVQLAGSKRVRMFNPQVGNAVFAHVQRSIGGRASATMRGVEMMEGEERRVLEEAVWDEQAEAPWRADEFECEVRAGDGLFIPKGWWHSIKSFGEGMTGSVNWWFR